MMDPGRDSILKVIDGHGNGCHGFHIVCKSERSTFHLSERSGGELDRKLSSP